MKKLYVLLFFAMHIKLFYCQSLTTSLTGCFNMNGHVHNSVNNLHGIMTLASSTSPVLSWYDRFNVANSSIRFVGTPYSHIKIPNDPSFKPSTNMTFSGWVYFNSFNQPFNQLLFTKNSQTITSAAYELGVTVTQTGFVLKAAKTGLTGKDSVLGTTQLVNLTWYHVALTMDNSNINIYLNGILEGSVATTFQGFNYDPTKDVILGGNDESTNNFPFIGYMDNLRFYNRALSATEINQLYITDPSCSTALPQPPVCDGTFYAIAKGAIYAYKNIAINSVSTPTIIDVVLPDSAHTLAIGPSFGFSAPNPTYWTIGKFSKLFYFDGIKFINSNHSCGNSGIAGIGGSKNFIYLYDNFNTQIFRYNGTGDATAFAPAPILVNASAFDIVGDDTDNYYIIGQESFQKIGMYNPSGNLLFKMVTFNLPISSAGSSGMAIHENTVIMNPTATMPLYVATPSVVAAFPVMNFTASATNFSLIDDMANCYVSYSSTITASSNAVLSCNTPVVTLSVTTTNYIPSFAWAGPGLISANGNTANVNQPGVYTCTITNGLLLNKYVKTYTVTHSNAPLIITASPQNNLLCTPSTGSTITANGANNYTWTPNTAISTNTNAIVIINPSANSVYTVTGATTGTCIATETISVLVKPKPTINVVLDSLICVGEAATLTASGAATYSWSTGSNSTSIIVYPAINTTYTVSGTDTAGCKNISVITQNVDPCLGIKKNILNDPEFSIFPNPTHSEFTLTINKNFENTQIDIYNSTGKLLITIKPNGKNTVVNLEDLVNGIYLIKIADQFSRQSFKVIKN